MLINKGQTLRDFFHFSGDGLSCIVCDSAGDKECGDPFTANQDKYLVKCEADQKFCRKSVSTEDPRSREYTTVQANEQISKQTNTQKTVYHVKGFSVVLKMQLNPDILGC